MALQQTHRRLEHVTRFAAMIGGFGIIFISVMVTVDVILRKFFGTTLGGASEVAGMVFAVATAISYPYVLLDRANIRIDVLYSRISVKTRAFLDLIALLAFLYFGYRLTYSAYELLSKSWNGGTRSVGVINVPLWMPQSLWVLGYLIFTLTALFLTVYAILCLLRRDWARVVAIAGVPSIEETIEEETHLDVDLSDVPHGSADPEDKR